MCFSLRRPEHGCTALHENDRPLARRALTKKNRLQAGQSKETEKKRQYYTHEKFRKLKARFVRAMQIGGESRVWFAFISPDM